MRKQVCLLGVFLLLGLMTYAQESSNSDIERYNDRIPVPGWSWEGSLGLMVGGSDFTDSWITGTQLALGRRYTSPSGQLISGGLGYRTLDVSTTVKGVYAQATLGQNFRVKGRGFALQVSGGYPITQTATNADVVFNGGWFIVPRLAYYCKLGDHMAQLSLGLYTSEITNELVVDDFERYQDWDIKRTSMTLTVLF